MNLEMPYGPRDRGTIPAGDINFIGVEERLAPQSLPPGYVAAARNRRFRTGKAETRGGITLLPWMKNGGLTPFTTVYGGAVFSDPNQSGQWILMAADGGVWKTRPNRPAQPVPLPAGVTLSAATFTKFIQANAAIILLRGFNERPLVCYDLEQGFQAIVQTNTWDVTFDHATNYLGFPANNLLVGDALRFTGAGIPAAVVADTTYYVLATPNADSVTIAATPGGTQILFSTGAGDAVVDSGTVRVLDGSEEIPNASTGYFKFNRLYLIDGKDTEVVSDIGDFTRYQPIQSSYRINEGDSHTLEAIAVFSETTQIAFKSGSVEKVLGANDPPTAQGPWNVTPSFGIAGPEAFCVYGNDIYFLTSDLRVSSLRLTELNKEQGTDTALSDPLVKTFGRINAAYAARARLAVQDGYLHVALPFDDAQIVDGTNVLFSPFSEAPHHYTNTVAWTVATLTPGQKYQYRQGAYGGQLVNGTETLLGDADFVAQTNTISLYAWEGLDAGTYDVLDTVKAVLADGVLNGVAVYDFLRQAWAGSDEADGVVCVKDFIKFNYGSRERLGFLGSDGWLHLYDDGFEDEKLLPVNPAYVDVLVNDISLLEDGVSTIQVSDGDVVHAALSEFLNFPLHWGAAPPNQGGGLPTVRANLWRDSAGNGGYDQSATAPWATFTLGAEVDTEKIDYGVRFIGVTADNGLTVLPEIRINGVLVANGLSSWAFVDSHSGFEIQPVPIETQLRTRAYLCLRFTRQLPLVEISSEAKRFLSAALQLSGWSPKYTIKTITQGIGSDNAYVNDQLRNYLKYFDQFDKADWTPDNSADDFNAPGREDYAYPETGAGIYLGTGVDFDAHQEYVHRVPVSERGLWMQVEIVNTEGRLDLVATALEGQEGEVLGGVAVN